MFEVITTQGKARRGHFSCAHGTAADAGVHECGHPGRHQGRRWTPDDLKDMGCQIELSNTYHLHLRPGDQVVQADGRSPQVHELGRPHPDGQRRVPGVLPGQACGRSRRKGVTFAQPCGRASDLHGAGGVHDASSPISAPTSPWPLTSAWKTPPPTTTPRPVL